MFTGCEDRCGSRHHRQIAWAQTTGDTSAHHAKELRLVGSATAPESTQRGDDLELGPLGTFRPTTVRAILLALAKRAPLEPNITYGPYALYHQRQAQTADDGKDRPAHLKSRANGGQSATARKACHGRWPRVMGTNRKAELKKRYYIFRQVTFPAASDTTCL